LDLADFAEDNDFLLTVFSAFWLLAPSTNGVNKTTASAKAPAFLAMLRIPTPYFDAKIWLQFSKIPKNRT
jgi:hypothetical protein